MKNSQDAQKTQEMIIVTGPGKTLEVKNLAGIIKAEYEAGSDVGKLVQKIGTLETKTLRAISKTNDSITDSDNDDSPQALIRNNLNIMKEVLIKASKSKLPTDKPGMFGSMMQKIGIQDDPKKKFIDDFKDSQKTINAMDETIQTYLVQLEETNARILMNNRKYKISIKEIEDISEKMVQLQEHLEIEIEDMSEEDKNFYQNIILKVLVRRISDLKQISLIGKQTAGTFLMAVTGNNELSGIVNSTKEVTMTAIELGVQAALVLNEQKEINEVTKGFDDLAGQVMMNNADNQHAAMESIYQRSSEGSINAETYEKAMQKHLETLKMVQEKEKLTYSNMKANNLKYIQLNEKMDEQNSTQMLGSPAEAKVIGA